MVTAATALSMAGGALFLYEFVAFPQNLAQSLASLAEVVGGNSAAAVVFDDNRAALDSLRALQTSPNIVAARAYRRDGSILASYARDPEDRAWLQPPVGLYGENFSPEYVEVFRPIILGGKRVGGIGLRSDLRERGARLWVYAQGILVVLLISLLVAFVVSALLQRVVSFPILNLARVAARVSKEHDYSVRAVRETGDEIGGLVDGLNDMLTQIEARDRALTQAQTELEKRVQELQTEVAERQRVQKGLAAKTAELQRSNAELEQIAYVASHDLQEPLRIVASYTQLLARRYGEKLDGDAHEFIAFVVEGVNRMRTLIRDLLQYSRVGSRGQPLVPTNCEVVLNHALKHLQAAIAESQAVVTHDPLPVVIAADAQLGQVFQNLIGNAIKYRDSRPPQVHVSCQREGLNWLFSVRDNGIGLDPQYANRIFVIFQRLHGREQYPGNGIGLSVCKKIVERHGGKIWVESQAGQGATFYFTLPALMPEEASLTG